MTMFGATKFVVVCMLFLNLRQTKGTPVRQQRDVSIANTDNGGLLAKISITILASCDAAKQAGYGLNGLYMIDPDGKDTGVEPFHVHCDMTSDMDKGYTTVHHKNEDGGTVNNAESAGSFRVKIRYELLEEQISAVISVSSSCRQFIKYECTHSLFKNGQHYWLSGSKRMYNWGGVPTGRSGCACGITRTCDDPKEKCNCDVNDDVPREDQGYLTDKATLPVNELRFGDTGKKRERGFYMLGPLQCA